MNVCISINCRMFRDKLANLQIQLQQLQEIAHPEYARRVRRLEQQYDERIRLNEIHRDYLLECINQDFILEKKAAAKEFEEKKIELKENLIADFEDKKKHIESERHSMELNGDSMEVRFFINIFTFTTHFMFILIRLNLQ
jgi:Sin3 histone deacetylase corepressor complex component SDS3